MSGTVGRTPKWREQIGHGASYGEPWAASEDVLFLRDPGTGYRVIDGIEALTLGQGFCYWLWVRSLPKRKPNVTLSADGESPADRAMAGISDPEKFMEDVRILYKSHTGPLNRDECAEMSEAVSRLAAQLKGE